MERFATDHPTDAEILAAVAPPSDPRWQQLAALPPWADGAWDDDALVSLVALLDGLGLVVAFDRDAWSSKDRYPNGRGLAAAPPADSVRLITSSVRGERVHDGALRTALEDGSIAAAVARVRSRRP